MIESILVDEKEVKKWLVEKKGFNNLRNKRLTTFAVGIKLSLSGDRRDRLSELMAKELEIDYPTIHDRIKKEIYMNRVLQEEKDENGKAYVGIDLIFHLADEYYNYLMEEQKSE